MGGQYEGVIEKKPPKTAEELAAEAEKAEGAEYILQGPGAAPQAGQTEQTPEQFGAVRFHKAADGKAHFHDDARKMRVAMPMSVAYEFERAVNALQSFNWLDKVSNVRFNSVPRIEAGTAHPDVWLSPGPSAWSDAYKKLNEFFNSLRNNRT